MLALRLISLSTAPSLAAAATLPTEPGAVPAYNNFATQQLSTAAFLDETNAARIDNGLPPLRLNAELSAAASRKAADMLALGYWGHFRPAGDQPKAPWDFIHEAGYDYHYAGENLARGFKTAHGITAAWMASPTHRANLLSPNYTEVGFATVEMYAPNSAPVLLTVQMFGSL